MYVLRNICSALRTESPSNHFEFWLKPIKGLFYSPRAVRGLSACVAWVAFRHFVQIMIDTFPCGTRHPFKDPRTWSIRSIYLFWKCWKPGKNSNESDGIAFARYHIMCLDYDCDDATASFFWAFPYSNSTLIGICDQMYCTEPDSASSTVRQSLNEVTRRWRHGEPLEIASTEYRLRVTQLTFSRWGSRRRGV